MSGREARFEDRFGGLSSSLTPGAGDGATQGAKNGQPGSPSDSPPPIVAGSNPAPARPTQGYRTGKAVGPDQPQSGTSSAATPSLLREFADALDAERGHDKSMVTRIMRTAADDLERCERRLRRQVEFHREYRERAIAAEQALGLYGEAVPRV